VYYYFCPPAKKLTPEGKKKNKNTKQEKKAKQAKWAKYSMLRRLDINLIKNKQNNKTQIRTCNYKKVPTYSEIISISLSTKGDKVLHGFNLYIILLCK